MTVTSTVVRPRRLRRIAAVAVSVLAAALVWVMAQATATSLIVDVQDAEPPVRVGLGAVLLFAVQAALAGWLLLAILERHTSRPRLLWTSTAVGVLVLSFVPVLAVEATAGAKLYLAVMHLAVAAVLIPGMRPGETKEA